MHGDLALRNVLLTRDKVAKICDFGLSRSLYKRGEYVKTSDSPLPIKWMALESIEDGVFSPKSDVWSFGVTLWEIWELAKNPYFHHQPNEELINKLHEGYRLNKPQLASNELYSLLQCCWLKSPSQRPNFSEISSSLEALVEIFEKTKIGPCTNDSRIKVKEENRKDHLIIQEKYPSYVDMEKRPSTIDSYIKLGHDGYGICLVGGLQENEKHITDGIYV